MSEPLERAELIAAIEAGQTFQYEPFFNGPYSQFHRAPFVIGGITYHWAEQWMMACKARVFQDDDAYREILAAQSPGRCKDLGRQVAHYDEQVWDGIRFNCVVNGNVAKFGQNADLRELILASGDAIFIEASPTDKIWGVGLGLEHPGVLDPTKWRGENLLGFALVKTRQALRHEAI